MADFLGVAEELAGLGGSTVHLRCVHHEENTLDLVEELEERDGKECHELGGCHCLRLGGCLLREPVFLPELCHSFFFVGKVVAGRRLLVCEQGQLWTPCAADSASHAVDPTYLADCEYQVVPGMAGMGL